MFKLFSKFLTSGIGLWLDEGGAGGAGGEKPKDFETWLETQPDDVKALYSEHTSGLKSALQKERDANEKAKKDQARLAELEAKEKEREDATKSETDKLTTRATTAEAERDAARAERDSAQAALKTERIKNSIIAEASKMGFTDPADAYTLTDLKEIQIDDQGAVTGAAEAIKKLAEAKPYLLGKPAPKGDGMGTPKGGSGGKKKEDPNQKRAPVIRSL